jgi:hypothetical protein
MDSRPDAQKCHVPGTVGNDALILVAVNPQYSKRQTVDAVYCSCRCAGEDPNSRYCKCPTGFQCVHLLDPVDRLGSKELAGSYCVKDGTQYTEGESPTLPECSEALMDCGSYDGR